jgi:hypothetical protein
MKAKQSIIACLIGTLIVGIVSDGLYAVSDKPDLLYVWFRTRRSVAYEQAAFWFEAQITNQGMADAGACHCGLWLSLGDDLNTNDDIFIAEVPINALARGAAEWVRWEFTMPVVGTTAPYNVYGVIHTDSRGEVSEENENNLQVTAQVAFTGEVAAVIENAGKWVWKAKFNDRKGTAKGKLKARDFTHWPTVLQLLADDMDMNLHDGTTMATCDGPRDVAAKQARDGTVKKFFYKSKKDAVLVYKPRKDALVYKVWKNAQLPDTVAVSLTGDPTPSGHQSGQDGHAPTPAHPIPPPVQ